MTHMTHDRAASSFTALHTVTQSLTSQLAVTHNTQSTVNTTRGPRLSLSSMYTRTILVVAVVIVVDRQRQRERQRESLYSKPKQTNNSNTNHTRSLAIAKRPCDCCIILKSGSYTKAI